MKVLDVFTQEQIGMIIQALTEKSKRHEGIAKMTAKAGYGKASTIEKADTHQEIAMKFWQLASEISENSI